MYDQNDFDLSLRQLRGQLLLLLLMGSPFLAGIIVSFVLRIKLLTIVLSILLGIVVIFFYNMRVSPVTAYRRYLRNIRTGLQRETQGVVVSFDPEETFKEGVRFRPLVINVDPKMDPEGERLFYFDLCKPLPAVQAGDSVHVVSHGNYVLTIAGANVMPAH